MLYRLAKFVCILAALQVCGGHWLALQSVAWMGMLVSYSRDATLTLAVEKTFDGAHPCGLCKVVKSGRDEEQKQQEVKVLVQLDAVLAVVEQPIVPEASEWEYFVTVRTVELRILTPPTPPPLAA